MKSADNSFDKHRVRLAMEHRDDYQSEAAALTAIAGKLGCSPDSLRVWMRQVQRDGGERPSQTTAEKARIKELEREVRQVRQANEILRKALVGSAGQRNIFDLRCSERTHLGVFCAGGARPPVSSLRPRLPRLSFKYTERLAEAAIDLSVGTVGDAYDNALAECVIGLFKTEVIVSVRPDRSAAG